MVPMIAGIVINSANDLMFSKNGTIAALAAVLALMEVAAAWAKKAAVPMQFIFLHPQTRTGKTASLHWRG